MRALLIFAGVTCFAFNTSGQTLDLTCSVPTAAIAPSRLNDLCLDLRTRLRVRQDVWNNDVCASEYLRIGVRVSLGDLVARESLETVAGDKNTALQGMDATWPVSDPAFCGDGVIDDGRPPGNLDLGEECDDGNNDAGDGCSPNCLIETP